MLGDGSDGNAWKELQPWEVLSIDVNISDVLCSSSVSSEDFTEMCSSLSLFA